MREIEKGRVYQVDNFHKNDESAPEQYLHFVHREPKEDLTLETMYNGTTLTEVLTASLECLKYLDKTLPCGENMKAKDHIQRAIICLQLRKLDREERGVLGTHKP